MLRFVSTGGFHALADSKSLNLARGSDIPNWFGARAGSHHAHVERGGEELVVLGPDLG